MEFEDFGIIKQDEIINFLGLAEGEKNRVSKCIFYGGFRQDFGISLKPFFYCSLKSVDCETMILI